MLVTIQASMILLLLAWSYPKTDAFRVSMLYQRRIDFNNFSSIESPHNGHSFNHPHAPTNNLVSSSSKLRNQLGESDEIRQLLAYLAPQPSFPDSEEDMKHWNDEYDFTPSSSWKAGNRNKRTENHVGGCVAIGYWKNLGSNHYPRHIKNYTCTSLTCNSAGTSGQCRQKLYPVKVLRRNTAENSDLTDPGCDSNLPEDLRCNWKFVTINVTTYCECVATELSLFGR